MISPTLEPTDLIRATKIVVDVFAVLLWGSISIDNVKPRSAVVGIYFWMPIVLFLLALIALSAEVVGL